MQGIFSLSTGYCGTAVNHANSNFPDGAVLVHPPRGPLKSSNSEPDRCNSSRLRKEAERNQDGQFVRQIPGKNKFVRSQQRICWKKSPVKSASTHRMPEPCTIFAL